MVRSQVRRRKAPGLLFHSLHLLSDQFQLLARLRFRKECVHRTAYLSLLRRRRIRSRAEHRLAQHTMQGFHGSSCDFILGGPWRNPCMPPPRDMQGLCSTIGGVAGPKPLSRASLPSQRVFLRSITTTSPSQFASDCGVGFMYVWLQEWRLPTLDQTHLFVAQSAPKRAWHAPNRLAGLSHGEGRMTKALDCATRRQRRSSSLLPS